MGSLSVAEGTEGCLVLETWVVLLVENEHDSVVAESWNLGFVLQTVGRNNLCLVGLCGAVKSEDSLEGLPHTSIVHVVEGCVGIFRRAATLEVHTADVLTTLNPTAGEVGELWDEVVVGAVSETSLGT